jgi:hypothetical protein
LRIETDLSRKIKPCYLGPMIVVRRNRSGAYILAELSGAVRKLPFAAFRLIPYYPHSRTIFNITKGIDPAFIPDDDSLSEAL